MYVGATMLLCYVDESGNDQVLNCREAPPAVVLVGVTVAESRLKDVAWDYLQLKKMFRPQLCSVKLSELIRAEIKGADLRADIRSGSRRRIRYASRFIDKTLEILEEYNATITGRVWSKKDGETLPPFHYADGIAGMAQDFHAQAAAAQTQGMMILDARTKAKNTPNVHGITTRKFKSGGDPMPYLAESPVFGHSDAHILLQVADIVAASLVFPMACHAYCGDVQNNVHNDQSYRGIGERWGERVRALEHRYTDAEGRKRGGMVVSDARNRRSSVALYGPPVCTDPE